MRTHPTKLAGRTIALLLVALASLLGCSGLGTLAKAAFQRPEIIFRYATLHTIDLEGATVFVEVELVNPNGFGLDVARVDWTLDAEGERVADGTIPGGPQIPAGATVAFPIPVHVRFRDVPGILGLIRRGGSVRYEAKGDVGVRTPVGIIDLAISHEDRIPVPQLPTITFEGLTLRNASFTEVGLDVEVALRNPNFFPVPPGMVDFALELGEDASPVARVESATLPGLGPGMKEVFAVPVRLNLAAAGRAARELKVGRDVHARITGSAKLAGFTIPFHLAGPVPARR